jgi:hypothetical protein
MSTDELVGAAPNRNRVAGGILLALMFSMCLWPVVIGLAVAGLDRYPVVLVAVALAGLVLVAWLAMRTLAPIRIALTPAGIERRQRGRTTVTPWADVAGLWIFSSGRLRVLNVLPRDGGGGGKAGVRYRLPLPDAFRDDDVRDAAHRLSGGTVTLTDGPPAEPGDPVDVPRRIFRAPRRLWAVPAALTVLTLLLLVAMTLTGSAYWVGALAPVFVWTMLAWWRVTGRSVLDAEGFTVSGTTIPWSRVHAVNEERIGPWRTVRVTTSALSQGRALRGLIDQPPGNPGYGAGAEAVRAACVGRVPFNRVRVNAWLLGLVTVIVPVPMIGLAAYASSPWNAHWWPGVQIATQSPDPCDFLTSDAARRLVPDAAAALPGSGFDGRRLECKLDTLEATLTLVVERSDPRTGRSADEQARDDYRFASGVVEDGVPLPGVGDEAVIGVDRQTTVDIAARRSNVVFRLSYAGRRTDTEAVRADTVEIVRAAVAAVRVR